MPCGEAERDGGRRERAADRDQPAGARVGAPQPARDEHRDAGHDARSRAASRPGRRGSRRAAGARRCRRRTRRRRHRRRARRRRPARRPGRRGGRGRCSRRSATRCCCRSCPTPTGRLAAGVSATSSGHAPPTTAIAAPPASSWPHARPAGRAARPTGRRRRCPGTTISAAAIFASKPSPTATPASTSQRVRPSSSAAHDAPQRGDGAEDQQRVRVVVARDRDRDRREREHEPGDEPARAAEAPAHEVVDERDRRDAHQRLRHEHAQRVEAEHLHRQRLDPEGERRLVDGHHARGVERPVQERVPARAHRAHGGAVVLVGAAVAARAPTGSARRRARSRPAARAGAREWRGRAGAARCGPSLDGDRSHACQGRHGRWEQPQRRLGVG